MVAQPARWSTFAVSCSALAFPDRSTGSWHQTSEMIQEDMKIMEPQRTQRSLREKHGETRRKGTMMEEDQINRITERIIGLRSRFIGRLDLGCSNRPIARASPTS